MFSTTLTDSRSFGNTYQWAILSILPMENGINSGLRPTDINQELGMPNAARTTVSMLLKDMAERGLVLRHEITPRWVEYTRLLPLRKRERISRYLKGM